MKKFILLFSFLTTLSGFALAQNSPYQLSAHILDINLGKPANDVKIALFKQQPDASWQLVAERITDANGRVKDFLPLTAGTDNRGIYKIRYYTKPYFEAQGTSTFYPYIEVVFEVSDAQAHYYVPITLSPFGYSTYRGN